jgi:hypothetical protein
MQKHRCSLIELKPCSIMLTCIGLRHSGSAVHTISSRYTGA